MTLTEIASNKCFGGYQKIFCHESNELGCKVNFGIFLPPVAVNCEEDQKFPSLYWLSGLTCTETNFVQKAGFQRYAAEHDMIVINPDTSPRGCGIEGEDDCYDFGSGAGFYVDATEEKWKNNYRMYSYVTKELPELIEKNFPVIVNKRSIFGHSMGGHGALICALKNSDAYVSVSAFAPICNPSNCAWGKKAFTGYLGSSREDWEQYDACCLAKNCQTPLQVLIDQGTSDPFYKEGQLLPENFANVCSQSELKLELRMQQGYDHSYFFMATFIEDHIKFHAKHWKM